MNITECLFRVLDCETTGLDVETAKIVEVGVCDVYMPHVMGAPARGNTRSWMQSGAEAWLCNPGIPIPPEAKAVHHIIDADVGNEPPASALMGELVPREASPRLVFVAHNAKYDRPIFERASFPPGRLWLCTHRLAMHVWPEAPGYKNEVLRYWLGHDVMPGQVTRTPQRSHRAAHDAAVTALVLREALEMLPTRANHLVQPIDVETLIAWAESPVVLKGKVGFGKYFDKTWEELAQIDGGYLDWMIKQEQREPGSWDLDKIHTARSYRGRLV